jgi:CBS domain-containing protein
MEPVSKRKVGEMRAIALIQQPVIAATPSASARDVAVQLVRMGISGMPVTELDGTVIGVVTEADILWALADDRPLETLTAQDIMATDPITVDVETPLAEVIRTVRDNGILRVPVTEQGKLVGIISRCDIIRAMVDLQPLPAPDFLMF